MTSKGDNQSARGDYTVPHQRYLQRRQPNSKPAEIAPQTYLQRRQPISTHREETKAQQITSSIANTLSEAIANQHAGINYAARKNSKAIAYHHTGREIRRITHLQRRDGQSAHAGSKLRRKFTFRARAQTHTTRGAGGAYLGFAGTNKIHSPLHLRSSQKIPLSTFTRDRKIRFTKTIKYFHQRP